MNAVVVEAAAAGTPFALLGFPCNEFMLQTPGANRTEILHGFQYVRPGNGYQPNFPWFGPINVNGEESIGLPDTPTLPLYTFLKSICPPYQAALNNKNIMMWDPIASGDVVWNYEKYLINDQGYVVRRFSPDVTVREIYDEYILPNYL